MSNHSNNKKPNFKLPFGNLKKKNDAHQNEHQVWSRRSFLQTLGVVGGGSMMLGNMPVSASSLTPLGAALTQSENDRVLVIIRLKGGNDGLNTTVPLYDYDTYADLRPDVRIQDSDLFELSNDIGMPNYMDPIEGLWNDGKMKIIHGVGYPDQSLSHFRSSDIWASSSDEDEYVDSGLLGRYYEDEIPDFLTDPPEFPPAVQIGSIGNLLFTGSDSTNYAFSVANPEQLYTLAQNGWLHDAINVPECYYGDQVAYLRAIANNTFIYANVINDAYTASTNSVVYDDYTLSNQLALVARMIKGGLGTKIYMVTLDGYDTHAEQPENHSALMEDVTKGVKNFFNDLEATNNDQDVMCMTISEFGRRVEQNASFGTDHGAAAPVMFFGPELNGNGFVGDQSELNDTDFAGNLNFGIDFRQIWATVLEDWLCIDSDFVDEVLLGQFERLDLGFECIGDAVSEHKQIGLSHNPVYMENGQVFIDYSLENNRHVQIRVFNVMGQQVAELENGLKSGGKHRVEIKNNSSAIATGQYYYQILIGGKSFNRSVMLVRK